MLSVPKARCSNLLQGAKWARVECAQRLHLSFNSPEAEWCRAVMDGDLRQQGLLAAPCPESDEQPAQNEDKAPVSFDGRQTKLVLKLVSQNNIQTNTQINAKCLNCQENSAHLSYLRGRGDHRVWQLPESPGRWERKLSLGTDSLIQHFPPEHGAQGGLEGVMGKNSQLWPHTGAGW